MQIRDRAGGSLLISGIALLGLALLVTARSGNTPAIPGASGSGRPSAAPLDTPSATSSPTPPPNQDAVLLAVGDIGWCGGTDDEAVADLASGVPGTIALLGDIAYPDGSGAHYADCFDLAWGSMRDRFRPVPGNHEYETAGAAGYFSYFGAAAGTPAQGWYSYDLGAWHVVALNSECGAIGGCGIGSPELAWLMTDLAAHPATCTLAYWHHPRYSSGLHGDNDMTDALWHALADAGADLVLTGHDHDYERIAPIDGLRSFVVGTGGRSLYDWPGSPGRFTERRANDTYGLLELTLGQADYAWEFIPASGGSFTDSGTGTCR